VNSETFCTILITINLEEIFNFKFIKISKLLIKKIKIMNNIFRGLLAGYGAKKLGGGCFGTIIVFIILWVLLGQCN